jgi:hypothetical protein
MWFSILVRKLLRRASFTSVEDLQARVFTFVAYFNATMAKPFKLIICQISYLIFLIVHL